MGSYRSDAIFKIDQWESVIDSYPSNPDWPKYNRTLKMAESLLKSDLALFEVDLIVKTLLFNPVCLLQIVSTKSNDSNWLQKTIEDSLKLLANIIKEHHQRIDKYMSNIIELCSQTYMPSIQIHVYACLTESVRVTREAAVDWKRYLQMLSTATTGKAPLVLLVGAICENYPDLIEYEMPTVWRTFLILLETNKNTETVISAILQAISGLFKNFGTDLPVNELNNFFEDLSSKFINMSRCQNVCFSMLENYSDLFKEKISSDRRLRHLLWCELRNKKPCDVTIKAVYKVVLDAFPVNVLQNVYNTEISNKVSNYDSKIRLTALYVRQDMKVKGVIVSQETYDVQDMEIRLGNGRITPDIYLNMIRLIESNMADVDRLISAAILYYENLPEKNRHLIAHALLKTDGHIRTLSINYLISITCNLTMHTMENVDTISKYMPLWNDLLTVKDVVLMERVRYVVEDVMAYVLMVLDQSLLSDVNSEIQKKTSQIFHLASKLLNVIQSDFYIKDYADTAITLLIDYVYIHQNSWECVSLGRAILKHTDCLRKEFCQLIDIHNSTEEATMTEACLLYIDNIELDDQELIPDLLNAIEYIFTRNNLDPVLLLNTLEKFGSVITKTNNVDYKNSIDKIISLISDIRQIIDMNSKDGRIIQRKMTLFLGKYSSGRNQSDSDTEIITKLSNTLVLNLPDIYGGKNAKINLKRILHSAIKEENPDVLSLMLTILHANPQSEFSDACIARLVIAMCRCHCSKGSLNLSILSSVRASSAPHIIQLINKENSPGVRRMVCDILEDLLCDASDELLTTVAERCSLMMKSSDTLTKRAGLDLAETLSLSLKENNTLLRKILPEILTTIVKTSDCSFERTFQSASKVLIDKIELIDNESIEKLLNDLFEVMMTDKIKMAGWFDFKLYKATVKVVLKFIASYNNCGDELIEKYIKHIVSNNDVVFEKVLFVLAEIQKTFDLKMDTKRNMLSKSTVIDFKRLFDMKFMCINDAGYINMEIYLNFMQSFRDNLLELEYKKTISLLSTIINSMTSQCIKLIKTPIHRCLKSYSETWTNIPNDLLKSFQKWCNNIPLHNITQCLEKNIFISNHTSDVRAFKIMLESINLPRHTLVLSEERRIKKWPEIILKIFSKDQFDSYKSKMTFLSDLLSVSVRFMSLMEIKRLVLEGHKVKGVSNERIGVKFCRVFMDTFSDVLLQKPFMLLDEEMTPCLDLLNDLVKSCVGKKCFMLDENLLELIEQIWPKYKIQASKEDKKALLINMSYLSKNADLDSSPLRWLDEQLGDSKNDYRFELIAAVPVGDEYSCMYRKFALTLPTKLSEMKEQSGLLLEALGRSQDLTLLDIVLSLVDNDDNDDVWTKAMAACMAQLAATPKMAAYRAIYKRTTNGMSTYVTRRMMVPLLKFSKTQFHDRTFYETFFYMVIEDLLSTLRRANPSDSLQSNKLIAYVNALLLLHTTFEVIPLSILESPSSILYRSTNPEKSWHLLRETCKLCAGLRAKINFEGSEQDIIRLVREFHMENYNCLSSAIIKFTTNDKIYSMMFNIDIWCKILDENKQYRLPIRYLPGRVQSLSVASSSKMASALTSRLTASSVASSPRTAVFLTTLSEDPNTYDLYDEVEEESDNVPTIQLPTTELNEHPCSSTLTTIINKASELEHRVWLHTICSAMTGEVHLNVKWFLGQAICNCKEQLKPHASVLRPVLLEFLIQTAQDSDCRKVFNGLHIETIETLCYWNENLSNDQRQADALSLSQEIVVKVIEYLLNTCLANRELKYLGYTMSKFLKMHHIDKLVLKDITIDYNDEYLIKLLTFISKENTYIDLDNESLLKNLESTIHARVLAEMFGTNLKACKNEGVKLSCLNKFRCVLNSILVPNRDIGKYLKVLFYAEMKCNGCCDEKNFKFVTDQAPKIKGAEKSKCLKILTSYLSNARTLNEDTDRCFETIDISELIQTDTVASLELIVSGLPVMKEVLKRRIVMQVVNYCFDTEWSVRKAAQLVMLKVLEGLYTNDEEMSIKRKKLALTTPILNETLKNDDFMNRVLCCLGYGVSDKNENVSSTIRNSLSQILCSSNITVRFLECFTIALYLPLARKLIDQFQSGDGVVALLQMLYSHKDRLNIHKLATQPTEDKIVTGTSKITTLSKSYQGTLTSYSRKKTEQITDHSLSKIDVEISISEIMNRLLKYSEINNESSQALCLEVVANLLENLNPDFEFTERLCVHTAEILACEMNDLTPFFIELARSLMTHGSFAESLELPMKKLKHLTKNTDGYDLCTLAYEDVWLRSSKVDAVYEYMLGSFENDEVPMDQDMANRAFSLNGLVSAFGALSNWENLTLQKKESLINEDALPVLWTNDLLFEQIINEYTNNETNHWFNYLVSACKQEERNSMKWLRLADQWPTKPFAVSVITEAFLLQKLESEVSEFWSCDIQTADCLAEWAARLMIRSLAIDKFEYNGDITKEDLINSIQKQELQWSNEALERNIPHIALQCIEKDREPIEYLDSTWSLLKLKAKYCIAARDKDVFMLEDISRSADILDSSGDKSYKCAVDLIELKLKLAEQLQECTKDTLNASMENLECTFVELSQNTSSFSVEEKKSIHNLCDNILRCCHELWKKHEDSNTRDDLLRVMCKSVGKIQCLNTKSNSKIYVDYLLSKLATLDVALSTTVECDLLNLLQNLLQYIDEFSINTLKLSIVTKISISNLNDYPRLLAHLEYSKSSLEACKKKLLLLSDAAYAMLQYVLKLFDALVKRNEQDWKSIMDKIFSKIYENDFVGLDYAVLNKFKVDLLNIRTYESSDSFHGRARAILKKIEPLCRGRAVRSRLRLSELCPSLAQPDVDKDGDISKVLGLKGGVSLVKFEEQIQVVTGSIRRPVVITALLSTGIRRKYLHKSGESLWADAGALRVGGVCAQWAGPGSSGARYVVTPLSDDCGLIEYLEDHQTLRSMIMKDNDLNSILSPVCKGKEQELILASTSALEQYKSNCKKMPAHALRSAIEACSVSVEDFIKKKQNFQNSWSFMTVTNWILGIGDRHLENTMISSVDSSVCSIDWGAIFSHGSAELPPARITRTAVAVCDHSVLESRIQHLLMSLQSNGFLFMPILEVSFEGIKEQFEKKKSFIEKILNQEILPHEIILEVIENSTKIKYKEKHRDLFRDVFPGYQKKSYYTVVEQVTDLLRASSDPRILSVVRPKWEPWV